MTTMNKETQGTYKYTGIKTANPSESEHGKCLEIINLRPENGKYVAVGEKKEGMELGTKITKIHKHLDGVIAHVEDYYFNRLSVIRHIKSKDNYTDLLDLEPENQELYSIGHYGNVLIVCTSKDKYHFLWEEKEQKYRKLPDLNPLKIIARGGFPIYMPLPPVSYIGQPTIELAIGSYLEDVTYYKERGYIEGAFMLRAALRYYDGSYSNYSEPQFIHLGKHNTGRSIVAPQREDLLRLQYSNNVYNVIDKKFDKLLVTFKEIKNLDKYKDIIKSIDFFITKPKSLYNIDHKFEGELQYRTTFPIKPNFIGSIADDSVYYLIKSIPIDQLNSWGNYFTSDNETFASMETKIPLPIDEDTNHKIIGRKQFLYNDSVLFADILKKFGVGHYGLVYHNNDLNNLGDYYQSMYFMYPCTTTLPGFALKWLIEGVYNQQPIKILTEADVYGAFFSKLTETGTIPPTLNPEYLIINPVQSYPHLGMKSMKMIYWKNGIWKYVKYGEGLENVTMDLKDHETDNLSFKKSAAEYNSSGAFNNNYKTIDLNYALQNGEIVPPELLSQTQIFGNSRNTIRASAGGTPFVLPTPRTYSVGENINIIDGMTTAQAALSEGQFGMFPLYIFTRAGIYLMTVGQGAVLFDRVQYMNDTQLVNPDLLLNVNNSVIFWNGSDVCVMTGNSIKTITNEIRELTNNELVEDDDYIRFTSLNNVNLRLQNVSLESYMSKAASAYCKEYKEIYFSNPAYEFTWVYSLTSGTWHKIAATFSLSYRDSDSIIYSDDGRTAKLGEKEEPTFINILLQTNPVGFAGSFFKLRSTQLQCDLLTDAEEEVGSYLFGSVADSYAFIQGKQVQRERIHKITTSKAGMGATLKRFIQVVAAKVKTGSELIDFSYILASKQSKRFR